jgi:hypothetical protein
MFNARANNADGGSTIFALQKSLLPDCKPRIHAGVLGYVHCRYPIFNNYNLLARFCKEGLIDKASAMVYYCRISIIENREVGIFLNNTLSLLQNYHSTACILGLLKLLGFTGFLLLRAYRKLLNGQQQFETSRNLVLIIHHRPVADIGPNCKSFQEWTCRDACCFFPKREYLGDYHQIPISMIQRSHAVII